MKTMSIVNVSLYKWCKKWDRVNYNQLDTASIYNLILGSNHNLFLTWKGKEKLLGYFEERAEHEQLVIIKVIKSDI